MFSINETPVAVRIDAAMLWVTLADHRMIGTPLGWYPFLANASSRQRENIQLKWNAIWWPDLDEGLSIDGMLRGVNPQEEQVATTEKTSSVEHLTQTAP